MLFTFLPLLAALALPATLHAAPLMPRQTSRNQYITNAVDAANVLNSWYNPSNGQWDNNWWQSANTVTTIADLAALDADSVDAATGMFEEVFSAAQAINGGDWLNDYYDDEGWWAMAWIRVYDVTQNKTYLSAAEDIFDDLLTGLDGPCGGQWWDKQKSQMNAINNELFIAVGASLANRISEKKSYYQDYALKQTNWLFNTGMLSENNTFHDGMNITDCTVRGTVFTYNQGVILGALDQLSRTTGNYSWLDTGAKVAQGAVDTLVDSNGIMTETGSFPTNDLTADQFKGVLARNLGIFQGVHPDDSYVTYLQKSADAIWADDRTDDGYLGPNYQGPPYNQTAPAQSSALDCLVAAGLVTP